MSEPKEWTLMFYFAGDNNLAPLVVSLLKEIKDAGSQPDTDVLVYFDPNELGVPTRIFNVNHGSKKRKKAQIGQGTDPFVHNMRSDSVDLDKMKVVPGTFTEKMSRMLKFPDEVMAEESLETFLGFCREKYPAKRYMLFLLGHGLVVGNDAFLPDDHPMSAITLCRLGGIVRGFTKALGKDSSLELLALHSCSMSAIEVAYELKGTAKSMMASEGPAFVGSWPYRHLLIKTFNVSEKAVEDAQQKAAQMKAGQAKAVILPIIKAPALVKKLYYLTVYNAVDFLFAGYSHDLAFCSLNPGKINRLMTALHQLIVLLNKGLKQTNDKVKARAERGKRVKEMVLLAHWEAQSYWGESYTDLYDFCRCLREHCKPEDELAQACCDVMSALKAVVLSHNFGSKVQYSHGLSIFFPWSKPATAAETESDETKKQYESGDNNQSTAPERPKERYEKQGMGIWERYEQYAFTQDLKKVDKENSWFDFLDIYFEVTKRKFRQEEDGTPLLPKFVSSRGSSPPLGALAGLLSRDKPDPSLDKPDPSVGVDYACLAIKNYPDERDLRKRWEEARKKAGVTQLKSALQNQIDQQITAAAQEVLASAD
ncbi:MAG: clostripain-related cysteine peptidase [Blastocatellia bacterium]